MKIYLASPLFNPLQKERIKKVVNRLRDEGHEVYSPMEHEVPNAWDLANYVWARKVYEADMDALIEADAVVAIYDGMDSDSGTAWEIGYACAMKKSVHLLLTRPREMQSLMLINSADSIQTVDGFLNEDAPLLFYELIQS